VSLNNLLGQGKPIFYLHLSNGWKI
jgi:hypothetical protein